jgi:hypothetical protein
LADASDFWFWLLNLGAAVLGGGWFAFRWLHIARMIEDTPTSRIRAAAQGYVELQGRCSALAGTQNLGPLTQRECVWWRYRIQHRGESGGRNRRESWRTVASGHSELPFLLDDGTGECVVKPSGAEIMVGESTTWYGTTPWPTAPPGAALTLGGERDYRYFEERIYAHEQLYALGEFQTLSGEAFDDPDEAVRVLLAKWKEDQDDLARRFDRDRDGKVSLAEWEKARNAARQAVTAERPPAPSVNVLSRPVDGQLFLLAAFPAGDVARRYRRRALFGFIGVAAAVYALGWLVQGVLTKA